ncbi:MAG: GGDEF domain-containing protein [Anaerolinea sp.]|nr:GGDEF domain-containing protein [Anaerolinea sp.]
MDVDHFKDFNNTYSYAVGDRALRHVADTLRASLREVDIIARYGGDEFVVFLPQTPLNEAKGIAERIQRQLAQNPLEVRQGSLPVNVTIGIYDLSQKDVNLLSVLETAGKIMRQAKENYSGIASL